MILRSSVRKSGARERAKLGAERGETSRETFVREERNFRTNEKKNEKKKKKKKKKKKREREVRIDETFRDIARAKKVRKEMTEKARKAKTRR